VISEDSVRVAITARGAVCARLDDEEKEVGDDEKGPLYVDPTLLLRTVSEVSTERDP